MSNGNLDSSAPLVGVLKLQITWPKQRGLEPNWTSPRWVITAISRSTTHPRKLVTEKSAAHTAGPLGSTRPHPAIHAVVWTIRMSAHSRTDDTCRDQRHRKKEKSRADQAMGPPRRPDGNHVLMRGPMWLGVTHQERPSREEAWNDEIIASLVEGRTNWELLIFQVCQTSVNHHRDHRYLHPPLPAAVPMQLSFTGARGDHVTVSTWAVQHQAHVIIIIFTRGTGSKCAWQQPGCLRAANTRSLKITLKCIRRKWMRWSLHFSVTLCCWLALWWAGRLASWSRSCGPIIKTYPWYLKAGVEQGASLSPVNFSLPEQSLYQVWGEGRTHMEQGDFVPISKNLTTQLGRTDGNNYNKEEKEI